MSNFANIFRGEIATRTKQIMFAMNFNKNPNSTNYFYNLKIFHSPSVQFVQLLKWAKYLK